MFRFLLAVSFAAIVIAGCSSSTTPAGTSSYLVSTTGTYFINSNVTLEKDSATGVVSEVEPYEDSTVVTGKESKTDSKGLTKTAVVMVTYLNGAPTDTNYVAEDGAKIYLFLDLSAASVPGVDGVSLGTRWTLIADQNATAEWTAITDSVSNLDIDYNGTALKADVGVSVKCKKNGTENLTINGALVETIKYQMTYNITMYINIGIAVVPIPVSFSSEIWLGKGVGLVKQIQQPSTVTVAALGFGFDIPGYRTAVIKYKIVS
ncbi:MAG: hypothetical protein HQ472_09420 [Ignavibacteria bacterium]|nr:hypothetical protein [Ignavibacteria bacterium]